MGIIYNAPGYINSQSCQQRISLSPTFKQVSRSRKEKKKKKKCHYRPHPKTTLNHKQPIKTLTRQNIQFLKSIGLNVVAAGGK